MPADAATGSGEPQVFELAVNSRGGGGRMIRLLGFVGGAAFVVLWAVALLPLLLQPPHSFLFCGRGGCQTIAPADYYSTLDTFTALLLGVAAVFFLVAALTFRAPPTELRVDAGGFALARGPKRPKRVSWDDPSMDCEFKDWRAAIRANPKVASRVPSPILMTTGFSGLSPPAAAMDAILASARGAGLQVRVEGADNREYPGTVQYFILSRRFSPKKP